MDRCCASSITRDEKNNKKTKFAMTKITGKRDIKLFDINPSDLGKARECLEREVNNEATSQRKMDCLDIVDIVEFWKVC